MPGEIFLSHVGLLDGQIYSTAPHLDNAGGPPHAEEVLPLQDGPEASLQRHYAPQHLLVEEGLQTVALRLPEEHLRDKKRQLDEPRDRTANGDETRNRRVAPWCGPLDSRRAAGESA